MDMFVTLSLCLLVRDSLYTEYLVVLVFGTRHQSLGPEIVDIDSACTRLSMVYFPMKGNGHPFAGITIPIKLLGKPNFIGRMNVHFY